jgi:hypothetical protein
VVAPAGRERLSASGAVQWVVYRRGVPRRIALSDGHMVQLPRELARAIAQRGLERGERIRVVGHYEPRTDRFVVDRIVFDDGESYQIRRFEFYGRPRYQRWDTRPPPPYAR